VAFGDTDAILELFSEFGRVSVRRMFGGAGIYHDGLMIGLISDGDIYLKADEQTVPDFEREGLGPFTYGTHKRVMTSYWRMPERLLDDTDELARWARNALGAARRFAARKPARGSTKRVGKKRKSVKARPKRPR
jgi:DNA transformation protein and related proteins